MSHLYKFIPTIFHLNFQHLIIQHQILVLRNQLFFNQLKIQSLEVQIDRYLTFHLLNLFFLFI